MPPERRRAELRKLAPNLLVCHAIARLQVLAARARVVEGSEWQIGVHRAHVRAVQVAAHGGVVRCVHARHLVHD